MVANWMISAMNTRLIHAVAAGMAVLFSSAAHADWQFTKWGMTPEQVIAASGGQASAVSPTGSTAASTLARMPFASGDLQFTASFVFDPARRLNMVRLEQTKGSGKVAYDALVAKFGEPVTGRNDAPEEIMDRYWTVGDDDIEFVYLAGTYRGTIVYQPHDPNRQPQQSENGKHL
jgi:hypothetical protein